METKRWVLVIGVLVIAILMSGCSKQAGPEIPVTPSGDGNTGTSSASSQYVFTDTKGNADRPVTVYIYRPSTWNTTGPILIAMPGAGRTGAPTRDVWIPYSQQYGVLVVVPEFSLQYYPTDTWYNLGNMFDENGGAMKNRQNWTFSTIEHLFDDIRARNGATRNSYVLFGHSAGGQFVHRLVTFLPEARYSRAVAANPGVYVMPDYTIPFAAGLKGSPLSEKDLKTVFSRKLIIMSGELDTNPNDPSLAHFPAADAQGANRFERARNYFNAAKKEAARLNVTLSWEYLTVPGVEHDEAAMAAAPAKLLFEGS